MEQLVK